MVTYGGCRRLLAPRRFNYERAGPQERPELLLGAAAVARPDVPVVAPGSEPVAAPGVFPLAPQLDGCAVRPSAEDLAAPPDLDVVVRGFFNGPPDELWRRGDGRAGAGREERRHRRGSGLLCRHVARFVVAPEHVVVADAVLEAGVPEARPSAAVDRDCQSPSACCTHDFDEAGIRRSVPRQDGATITGLHRQAHEGRSAGVVLEREGARAALVACDIATEAGYRGVCVVRSGVVDLRTGLDAGGGIAALEGDREGLVVPAVCVSPA